MKTPRTPPRFVPTLTEVVQPPMEIPVLVRGNTAASVTDPVDAAAPAKRQDSVALEDAMVHRVMQRVDVSLEHYLREAIALVVQEETRSLVPRLREELETVVRQSVHEAVADELASVASKTPGQLDEGRRAAT
jgi:hypothetical protein